MVTRVRQGQSAENEKTVKIPMDSNHNNNNDQHFLSICHISGTVLNPLSGFTHRIFMTNSERCVIFISIIYIYIYMEKAVAPHSSALAWKIPWAKEPGGLQFMGSQRIRHN